MKLFKVKIFFTGILAIATFGFGQTRVLSGLENLINQDFAPLKHKRVGLITNPSAVDSGLRSTIDIFYESPNVNLVALFGPEHGVRGDHTAGAKIKHYTDSKTGLPVYSLYGKTKKPDADMLKNIDILVYDIQDIGCRSYTYISTMGYAMEAAAENAVSFMVLDRPNPLGGEKVEGNIAGEDYFSLVSAFPIPYVYGLTCGELAKMINGEKYLKNAVTCELEVIPMKGWNRTMIFEETGLTWVPTSPHIPTAESAFYYVATGILGELGIISEGVGYTLPFKIFAAPWIDAENMAVAMNGLNLEGVLFRPVTFKPYYGKWAKQTLHGVQIHITNPKQCQLMSLQFYFLQEHHRLYPEKDIFGLSKDRHAMFDKVCGGDEMRKQFFKNYKFSDIDSLINGNVDSFRKLSQKYKLYNLLLPIRF